MPTGAASSTILPERSSVKIIHDGLGHQTPRKFLAKRTPRPRPQFVRATLSSQSCLQTSYAPLPNVPAPSQPSSHVPPSPSRGIPSQHRRSVSAQNDAGHSKETQVSRSPTSSQSPLSVQQPPDSSCVSRKLFVLSSYQQPYQQPRPKGGHEDEILDCSPMSPHDSINQIDPEAHIRKNQKGSTPTSLVIDLTQGDDLANDDAWTLNAIPRIVASEQINISFSGGASTRCSLPQSVLLGGPVTDQTEARKLATMSDQNTIGAISQNRTFHKTSRPNAAAGKGPFNNGLGSKACSRERRDATGSSDVTGEEINKMQKKKFFSNPHANVVQGTVSNTNGTRKRPHDSIGLTFLSKRVEFDAAIYGQPGAAQPPAEVKIRRPTPYKVENHQDDQRRYIHADPAIHLTHNRSDTWHARKALEIERRGGRKFWFGNVSGRLRWLRANKEVLPPQESDSRQDVNGINERLPRRRDAKSNAATRALDFGDVPEEDLPDYVQQNPAWLKACEFFRQTNERREARIRVSKMCEQETQDFFDKVIHVHAYDSE
ncbi:hypothetical protein E4U55_003749 [Claviceps digitariae]|nr:hypothetical protein E4U55_003749 [Claviceps digitariae]